MENDNSHYLHLQHHEYLITQAELQRPSILLKPKLYPDGNMWCALYGEDLQMGLAGFGKTPAAAMADFDNNYHNQKLKSEHEGDELCK